MLLSDEIETTVEIQGKAVPVIVSWQLYASGDYDPIDTCITAIKLLKPPEQRPDVIGYVDLTYYIGEEDEQLLEEVRGAAEYMLTDMEAAYVEETRNSYRYD